MTNLTTTPLQGANDTVRWEGLKRAIVGSSGFQRWCSETGCSVESGPDQSQEQLVIAYLRETLKTLAY